MMPYLRLAVVLLIMSGAMWAQSSPADNPTAAQPQQSKDLTPGEIIKRFSAKETELLVVPGKDVSWLHARIRCHKGRPLLTDVSTNGTFVHLDGAATSTHIHRDTVPLAGGGRLGLGRPPTSGDNAVVTFACRLVP